MSAEARENLQFEISQLDTLVEKIDHSLLEPADTEMFASYLGLMVHGFYNGLEKCLVFALALDGESRPAGERWHRQVLDHFAAELAPHRETITALLGFRHVIRHSYAFDLDPVRVQELAVRVPELWPALRTWLLEAYVLERGV